MPPAHCQPLPPGTVIDTYRVEKLISRGGYSLVYLARDSEEGLVVIKEYLPDALATRAAGSLEPQVNPEGQGKFNTGMRSFLEEAKLLARIRHPNVVSVLNFSKAHGTAYLVMRHEEGCSLHEHIVRKAKAGAPIREEFLRGVFVRLLAGLREVHKQKLLHLDLKPANIFLRRDGNPVLLDFGAARWGLGEAQVNLGNIYTLGFAAPEQQQADGELGPWTDIYAIGATLYSCLSGGVTPLAADRRLKGEVLPPAEVRWARQYSPQLLELIDWCLRLPIMARPQSIYALQKVLSGELLDIVDPSWFSS
ncbi:MAG TPA: serine/threonine-protein kinase [Rhodocyclaceae bacterium]|jgi:serine/threonine protein kinase|nr:serine/threonine protein kinase [Betaproteobacteria bacterium]HMU99540.1 serine/threonine-protein kinase [Rhodocyclaceae bacterium]HMV20134.1 serine/threonine-protein kinase [Rhodocyclaceae bacterium]HMW77177.1 serine/threonine-protein kinase [Rhodocyclaceae bacterium]HNE41670.1 serine/threonine-protein kinase [Rhodocyclaceae bacterium]